MRQENGKTVPIRVTRPHFRHISQWNADISMIPAIKMHKNIVDVSSSHVSIVKLAAQLHDTQNIFFYVLFIPRHARRNLTLTALISEHFAFIPVPVRTVARMDDTK